MRVVINQNLGKIAEYIKLNDDFLIASHINADGDAIASALVIGSILKSLNKNYTIILNEHPQDKYRYLTNIDDIQIYDDVSQTKYYNVITVDVPNLSRIANVREYVAEDAFIINIDHHGDNASFGNINEVYNASSTAEITYNLIKEMDVPITRDIAEMIYTGIIYDTGMFRFSITTELSFIIAAEMLRIGARVDKIAEQIFYEKDLETMKLLSHILNGATFHEDGKIGVISVAKKERNNNSSKKPEMDDFINYLMMTKGVEVGVFFMEMQTDYFRISFRAKNDFDVRNVAMAFSGGGHRKAAGCRMKGRLNDVKKKVLAEVKNQLLNAT